MTTGIAVVRPLSGSGLVVRAGDLLLVCADGGREVDDLLGLVAEVAAAGGDGGVLVRRVAALLAADFDGSFPACAVSGPTRDGRLAVLVYGTATATVVTRDGDVSLAGSDAITSVNRLISGPVTAIRLQLPNAGSADQRSRLDSGVVTAAGVLFSDPASQPSSEPVSELAPGPASEPAPGPGPASEPAFESAGGNGAPAPDPGSPVQSLFASRPVSRSDADSPPESPPNPLPQSPPQPPPLSPPLSPPESPQAVPSFGSAPAPESSFGAAPAGQSSFDGPPVPSSFGATPAPESSFGAAPDARPLSGDAPPPESSFGAAPAPEASFGTAPAQQSMVDSELPSPEPVPATAPPTAPAPPAPGDLAAPPAPAQPLAGVPDAPPAADELAGDGAQVRQPDPAAPFVAVLLAPGAQSAGWEGMDEPATPVPDTRPHVLGVRCENGHFNDPTTNSCAVCGVWMAEQTLVTHEGPRPPLGVLLLDDGMIVTLDVDYVLGREPQGDPEVTNGTVRPLRITDAEGVVSRRHLRVALVGWEVQVVDLGSANGTFIALAGDPQRHQLVPHQPVVIRPGTQVTMGRRWFRYESHRNP